MPYIPNISQAHTAQNNTVKTEEKKDALGQDEFLTLLVAQLQNQDPLNPTDATEFTAQLAQYSQLEQLFNLNDSMDSLATAQNNSERLSALSLIGQKVVVEGSQFSLGQGPAELGYQVSGPVTEIELQISNSSGQTVATIPVEDLSEGQHTITWDGRNQQGQLLDPGTYELSIRAQSTEEGAPAAVAPLVRAEVTGVDLTGSEAMVVTTSGTYNISAIHGAYNSPAEESEPGDGGETSSQAEETDQQVSDATDGAGIIEEPVTKNGA